MKSTPLMRSGGRDADYGRTPELPNGVMQRESPFVSFRTFGFLMGELHLHAVSEGAITNRLPST